MSSVTYKSSYLVSPISEQSLKAVKLLLGNWLHQMETTHRPEEKRHRPGKERGKGEEVWATLERYKGREYAHLRTYFLGRDGKHRATKRGVSVPLELFPELERAVLAIHDELDRWSRTLTDAQDPQATPQELVPP